MKTMLLAAGVGRRMLPLTLELPKPAIPILGRPIALEILRRLRRYGVQEAVINLHHLPRTVERLFGEGAEGALPRVRFSWEKRILGTAGGIGRAADLLRGAGPILVHNCDFLSDIDLAAVVRAHRISGLWATLVLAPARPGYPVVAVDSEGSVLSLAGRPEVDPGRVAARHLFTGCHVIDERILDLIPDEGPSDIVADVYRGLASRGQLGSFLHQGFWWEFGTPEHYLEGSLRLLGLPVERRVEISSHDPIRRIGEGVVCVGAGARMQDGATIEGRAALGMASLLGRDAYVRDSVIMPEAWVGPDCRLERAVVGPGAEVRAGFEGHDLLVVRGDGLLGDPGPGMRRDGELLIYDFVTRVGAG